MEPDPITEPQTGKPRHWLIWFCVSVCGLCLILLAFSWYATELNRPPDNFPSGTEITIAPGTSVRAITETLQAARVIRSATLLYVLLSWSHDPTTIKASTYRFNEPLSTTDVAERLMEGDYESTLVRITHIEGERVRQLAARLSETLPEFDAEAFVTLAEPHEGTLFPDTYLVPPTFTSDDVFTLLTETYRTTLAPHQAAIDSHPLSESDIITLASIVEREANDPDSKRMVAGILLSRISIGMPLQADASIEYTLNKPLSQLTPADLTIDTPYNTYLYRGLPPTPIGNPGLDAILAVLNPTESPYLFYITGNDGVFYYAETYTEHQRNIERYLR